MSFLSLINIITGYISCLLLIIGLLNGALSLWSSELRLYLKPNYVKLFHSINGAAAFVVGTLTTNTDCFFFMIELN